MASTQPKKRGVMVITLKKHLADLEDNELAKPPSERRKVPSMAELARIAGVASNTVSRWVTGETQSTDHRLITVIIHELRSRGFRTDVPDILAYRET